MQSTRKPKSKPVGVNTPYQDVVQFITLNDDKKAAERTLKTLKPRIDAMVPANRDAVIFERDELGAEIVYKGKRGIFKVQRVKQDRRQLSDELLEVMLQRVGLYKEGTTTTTRVDHEKVAELVDNGALTGKDVEACMVGVKTQYILVNFEERK